MKYLTRQGEMGALCRIGAFYIYFSVRNWSVAHSNRAIGARRFCLHNIFVINF
jgi:hypothetical protein